MNKKNYVIEGEKSYFRASCDLCGRKIEGFSKEFTGCLLIFWALSFLYFFGFSIVAIISLIIGFKWVITEPSRKVLCKECLKKNKK